MSTGKLELDNYLLRLSSQVILGCVKLAIKSTSMLMTLSSLCHHFKLVCVHFFHAYALYAIRKLPATRSSMNARTLILNTLDELDKVTNANPART